MNRSKGQFMLLSAIILSILVMSAAGVVSSVQNQRYEASSLGYYVSMLESEADKIDLSVPRERRQFQEQLSNIDEFSIDSDYWDTRHCYNVTLTNSMNNIELSCIGEPEIRSRVMAIGYNAREDDGGNSPIPPGKGAGSYGGIYDRGDEEWIIDAGRSYNLAVLDTETGEWVHRENYDVYGDASEAARMANYLEGLPQTGRYKVYVVTADEPKANRLSNGLETAMYRIGASERVYGSEDFERRSAYVLIGSPGIGEGNAYYEFYQGSTDNSPDAFVDRDIPVNY